MTPVPPMMLLAAWRGAAAAALTARARQSGPGLRACRAWRQEAPAALRPGAQARGIARAGLAKALTTEQLISERVRRTRLCRSRHRCLRPLLLPGQLDDRGRDRDGDKCDRSDPGEEFGIHAAPLSCRCPGTCWRCRADSRRRG